MRLYPCSVRRKSTAGRFAERVLHGFDDTGSQFDGDGNLREWWSKGTRGSFDAATKCVQDQFSQYEAVPGVKLDGALTSGENIADNSGLAVAYKAYRLSLGGKEAPVLDGITGDQRFFMGFAQAWRDKTRDNEAIMLIKADPHSPDRFRGLLTERNQDPFYTAFDVKAGDKMYLPSEQRVHLW